MKKLVLILLCLPMIGFGQDIGCISGDCGNGFGEYRYPNGDIFEGNWRGGLMHGEGTYTSDDGTMIKSFWENGLEVIEIVEDDVIIEYEIEIEDTESDEDEVIEIIEEDDDEFFIVVENMPIFPGGDLGLMKYIQKNVKYPAIAKEYNITGKVYVSFIVDKLGSVTNVKIVRGVDENLDAEAIRVIKSLPKYKPGKQRGKAVRVMFTIPINFKL